MSNIDDLIQEIEEQITIYNLKAQNQDNKTAICYEANTLSYANWILGLHKDVSPNTTKTVYLYTNVCKKDDSMYEEYLLLRPDKEITEDGKTLRKHMNEKYEEDEGALENNKKLLEKGRTELSRLQTEFNENKTLRNDKVNTLEQIQNKVDGEQQELTDKKTILKYEGLEDKLNEIKTELSKQEGELRDKEEQRDDIMNSLNTIITATPLPETNDDREDTVQAANDDRDDTVQTTEGMEQDTNDDDDNAGPTNEELEQLKKELEQLNKELEQLNEELQHLQQKKTDLEQQFSEINNRIQEQELGIATLEQTITKELESIQTLTQQLTELNKQGVSINEDIKRLDIVSTLEQKIEAHNENFGNKPNKLYEIEIKDFGNDHVKAVSILNADYIDITLLHEDVAYMVGKSNVVSIDDSDILYANTYQPLTEGSIADNRSVQEQGNTLPLSNTGTNNDTFDTDNIVTQNKRELPNYTIDYEDEDEDEESFLHDAAPQLIEDLQFIEKKFKAYDDYNGIQDTTIDDVQSIINDSIFGPLRELYTHAGAGDLKALLIINNLSNALKKKNIDKFLIMISDIKASINDYYKTPDNDKQERILNELFTKFRNFKGGTVKKQKPKKQKTLRKNNSFRKKRKAKV